MKKLLTFVCILFALSTSSFAQRIAVVDFNAGVGISQQDVDGISAIFGTYFSPNGYTFVERTSIDRVIDEQQFQRGKLTEQQMVKLGKILNVSKIVIGDVNIVSGEYNIDVRVVNVETGTVVAKEGGTWYQGDTYRELMAGIATRLANQIAINPQPTVVQQTLKIGDIYEVDGKVGIVWALSNDGKHGRILSLEQTEGSWDYAVKWCSELGEGWRLPTRQELTMLYKLKDNQAFVDGLFFADAPAMIEDYYWSGEESNSSYAWSVNMYGGYAYNRSKSSYDSVRAVSAF
ncbi:MAG: DUF1566 domain-containing protein [Tidjanibacter sp.]|nr:DUF1566 domain-containing protein [Tidjanibacter sp.]